MNRYTVEPGREIYRDGKPFIGITREGDTKPTEADDAAHWIAELLNLHGEKRRGRKLAK